MRAILTALRTGAYSCLSESGLITAVKRPKSKCKTAKNRATTRVSVQNSSGIQKLCDE